MDLKEAYKRFELAKKYKEAVQCLSHLYEEDRGNYELIKRFRKAAKNFPTEDSMSTLYESYRIAAKDRLDDYMIALEWDRDMEKKFWLPRRKTLLPLCNGLQALYDGEYDFLGVSLPPRVGKLVSDDTPVLTRRGWKNHGDLVEGDEVISPRGKFVRVTNVFPKDYADIAVKFSDGSCAEVHENHEWVLYDRHKHRFGLYETKSLMNDYTDGHRYFYFLPLKNFVEGEGKKLPVEPYTLGAWLGDGRNQHPDVCEPKGDRAIIESIIGDGYPVSWHTVHKTTGVEYFGFSGLREGLKSVGMCHSRKRTEKHIPQEYFTASITQRLDLLAGLLDTDGCLIRKEHRYQFSTTSERLRDDFVTLVSTFGWRCSVKRYEPAKSSSGVQGKLPRYVVGFNPTAYIPCRLPRKQLTEFSKPRRVSIVGFERIEPKRGNCISVEGGVYCIGRNLIPTHNSTLCIYFMSFLMGNRPDVANVMSGHSDKLTDGFYREVLSILTDTETYKWGNIFEGVSIVDTSAKNETIDLHKKKRFPTFTARSVSGTLTGAVEVGTGGCLYVDDLVEDLEESMSPDRLQAKYDAYLNQLKDRKKDGAFELMVGTRWNVFDPLGRIQNQYCDNQRYKFIVIPALNEKGESNFEYPYQLGFSTKYYLDMKASIDDATWCAKYMGNPYIREGLLYPKDSLRRYYDLPEGDPDAVVAVCDTAEGGGDDTFLPVFFQYGNDHYLVDCVCCSGLPEVTDEQCASILCKYNVQRCQFETNGPGGRTADKIEEKCKERDCRVHITKKRTLTQKETKIIVNSDWVKEHVLFLDDTRIIPGSQYQKMMNNLCLYTMVGKNKHDDVPDGLAQYALFVESSYGNIVKIVQRPF